MLTQFSRTELLLGKEAMDRLANAKVAVFGIGGGLPDESEPSDHSDKKDNWKIQDGCDERTNPGD